MNAPAPVTVTPVPVADLLADLLAEGERMPVRVHVVDHPEARVLVDGGLTELHPLVAGGRPVVVARDAAVWSGGPDEPRTEGRRLIRGWTRRWSGSRTGTSRGDPAPSRHRAGARGRRLRTRRTRR